MIHPLPFDQALGSACRTQGPPKPTRHLSLVPLVNQEPEPKVLDAYGKALSIGDLICLLARQYTQLQLNEIWRVEAFASDRVKAKPLRGFLKPLGYFPLVDVALYAKQGEPTPYLEGML